MNPTLNQVVSKSILPSVLTGNTTAKELQKLDGGHDSLLRPGRTECYELRKEPKGNEGCSSNALDDDAFVEEEGLLDKASGLERSDSAKC
jgi:hypothetical protein